MQQKKRTVKRQNGKGLGAVLAAPVLLPLLAARLAVRSNPPDLSKWRKQKGTGLPSSFKEPLSHTLVKDLILRRNEFAKRQKFKEELLWDLVW